MPINPMANRTLMANIPSQASRLSWEPQVQSQLSVQGPLTASSSTTGTPWPPSNITFSAMSAEGMTAASASNIVTAADVAQLKNSAPSQNAQRFYDATLGMWGMNLHAARDVLERVKRQGQEIPFAFALEQLTQQKKGKALDAKAIIEQETASNGMKRWLMAAPREELIPLLATNASPLSPQKNPSSWAYRRYGMVKSLTDFGDVVRRHPFAGGGIIAAIALLGHRYPFLGGLSGALIIGWSSVAMALHELKALGKKPGHEKSEHYIQSGENFTALVLTLSGADGIYKGLTNGLNQMKAPAVAGKTLAFPIEWGIRFWNATKAQLQHTQMGFFEGIRFVMGLFDNVLLPFNAAAEKIQGHK